MKRKAHRAIKPLTEDRLRLMTTRNLLAYLRRLHKCHAAPDQYEPSYTPRGYIFKQSAAWRTLHTLVKTILSEREHVEKC